MSFTFRHIPVESQSEFVSRSSAEIEQIIMDAVEENGRCILGLSGGSTPVPIYDELGSLVAIPWEKVTVFLVDERYIDEEDAQSNQKMLQETLLAGAGGSRIPGANIIVPDPSLDLEDCIEDYDFRIDQLLSEGIDAVVLGMGKDGHIASLFPGDIPVLTEDEKRVLHTTTDAYPIRDRITVTLPVLQAAKKHLFLLAGKDKKKMFTEVIGENEDTTSYPAQAILREGRSRWVTYWG